VRVAATGLLLAAVGFGLAGCDTSAVRNQTYVGTVTPDGACGQQSHATLSTAKGRFTFAPEDGVLLLRGDVGAAGALSATLATTGADRKPYVMRFDGTLDPQHVTGKYVTPRCSFTVNLDNNGQRAFETPYL
jgi:hypothetical protein